MSSSLRQTQQKDNLEEKINDILFDENDNIFYLYKLIKDSLESISFEGKDVCIVDYNPNDTNTTRTLAKCNDNQSTTVIYDPNQLILYGSAAYKMFIYTIMKIYKKYNIRLPNINSIIINDIDLILWPTVKGPDNNVFISKESNKLVDYYKKIRLNIENMFNKNKDVFISLFNTNNIIVTENNFKILVINSDSLEIGSNIITISFIINNKPYKIVELTIHDGASSQSVGIKKGVNGRILPIVPLKPMEYDPTYQKNIVRVFHDENQQLFINIPTFEDYIKQQILAYNNLEKMGKLDKINKIKKRLEYLQNLITNLLNQIEKNLFEKNQRTGILFLKSQVKDFDHYDFFFLKNVLNLINNFMNKDHTQSSITVQPMLMTLQPSTMQYQQPMMTHQPQQHRQQQISYIPQHQMTYIPQQPPLPQLMSQQPPLPPQYQPPFQQPPLPPQRGYYRGGKTKKKGHQLFNDNPRGRPRIKGIGYGTAKKARNSITRLKGKSKTYKRQVATTMFYRAKHHKYQNKGMRNAMKIWKKYINQLK
jgi:hypothetical protein